MNNIENYNKKLDEIMLEYNKVLKLRCIDFFDLSVEKLKELDFCLGLILTGDDFMKFNIICTDCCNFKERKIIFEVMNGCDSYLNTRLDICDADEIREIKACSKIIKEIFFER